MTHSCRNCGADIPEGASSCPICETSVSLPSSPKDTPEEPGRRVVLYPDGVYRWTYEVNMYKNSTIIKDVYMVLGISFGIVWLFIMVVGLTSGDMDLEYFWGFTKMFLILFAVLGVLALFAYWIVAHSYGGKYMCLFEMNEKGVVHHQMQKQVKKAQLISWLTVLVCLSGRSAGGAGRAILAATHTSLSSDFSRVKSLKADRSDHVIKVNGRLTRNRIYVCDEDFELVYEYMAARCPKAKKR